MYFAPATEATSRRGGHKVIVYSQPGFAVDWDWSAQLTVWSTDPTRFDQVIARHREDHPLDGKRTAAAVARRWWRNASQDEVAATGKPAHKQPKEDQR
jgi:hypothetical protein